MPIATVFPEDGVFVQVGPLALLAKAPHPNAGKLFIDWLTSPAGQTIHVTGGILSPLESPDTFLVSGRGELHLAILIETMRREGYELQVAQPEVIYHQDEDGRRTEPYERVEIAPIDECVDLVAIDHTSGQG